MSSIKQIRDLERSVDKLTGQLQEYQALLKNLDIPVPDHLQESETGSVLNGTLPNQETQSPENGSLSLPRLTIPKSPSPSVASSRRNSEFLEYSTPSPMSPNPNQHLLKTPDYSMGSRSRRSSSSLLHSPTVSHDYSAVLALLDKFNDGAFRPPPSHRNTLDFDGSGYKPIFHDFTNVKAQLPPRNIADQLIESYRNTYQHWLAPIAWDEFLTKIDSIYNQTSDALTPVLFMVMALGTRENVIPGISLETAHKFTAVAKHLIDMCTLDAQPSVNWTLTALLVSVFQSESNNMTRASVWLGMAWSMAYEQGLMYPRTAAQQQLWGSIFLWDRVLALRLGRMPLITEHYAQGQFGQPKELVYGNAMIHLTQIFDVAAQTINTQLVLAKESIDTFNAHFESLKSILPSTVMSTDVNMPLNGKDLSILFLMKYTQHVLLRINFSPLAQPSQLAAALDSCYSNAKSVCMIYKRFKNYILVNTAASDYTDTKWTKELGLISFDIMATHTWQCLLMVLANQDLESAEVLFAALRGQAYYRPNINRYGLFVDGFVQFLMKQFTKHKLKYKPLEKLDVIAIISTDLQNMDHHAWIWPKLQQPLPQPGKSTDSRDSTPPPAGATQLQIPSVVVDPGSPDNGPQSGDELEQEKVASPEYIIPEEGKTWDDWDMLAQRIQALKELLTKTLVQGTQDHRASMSSASRMSISNIL